jgi:hypothetical protein
MGRKVFGGPLVLGDVERGARRDAISQYPEPTLSLASGVYRPVGAVKAYPALKSTRLPKCQPNFNGWTNVPANPDPPPPPLRLVPVTSATNSRWCS